MMVFKNFGEKATTPLSDDGVSACRIDVYTRRMCEEAVTRDKMKKLRV